MKPKIFLIASLLVLLGVLSFINYHRRLSIPPLATSFPVLTLTPSPLPAPSSTPAPTPSPTPKPLTFAQLNQLYGPCVNLPVLYYHHVEPHETSVANHRTGLAVSPEIFESQLNYLRTHAYTSIFPEKLIAFFDTGTPLPAKSVLITFDDGYTDMYSYAFPLLKKYGYTAAMYLPTGLLNNPGYLTWAQVTEMSDSGAIYFGNHTWSHKSVRTNTAALKFEVETADTQLKQYNLNNPPTFVYPYGNSDAEAEQLLASLNYKLAFTTKYGTTMCKKLRFSLPRLRIGSVSLASYGL